MPYVKSLSILALMGFALGAHAADFNTDFNLSANPGTTGWTYGYTISFDNTLNPYSSLFDSGSNLIWHAPGLSGDYTPSVFKRYASSGDGVLTGQAGLHGGPAGQFSVARYTVSASGPVDIVGMFGAGDIGAVELHVLKNGASLFSRSSTQSDESFSLENVSVAAGDRIDFVVGTAGGYTYDSTPLSATITPVPEPASMTILGLGALGLLRRRRF